MGNLQTEVDVKEQFMAPMATILQEGVVKVKSYVDRLIDVVIDDTSGASVGKICVCVCVCVCVCAMTVHIVTV